MQAKKVIFNFFSQLFYFFLKFLKNSKKFKKIFANLQNFYYRIFCVILTQFAKKPGRQGPGLNDPLLLHKPITGILPV